MPETHDADQATAQIQWDAVRVCSQRAWQEVSANWARMQVTWQQCAEGGKLPRQELLKRSPFARLYARCVTMPVIEQAKGVLMFQQGCDADEAFDLLRRASQRSNVPVRMLAEQIVSSAQRHKAAS